MNSHRINSYKANNLKWIVPPIVLFVSSFLGMTLVQYISPTGLQLPPWAYIIAGVLGMVVFGIFALRSMQAALTLLIATSVLVNFTISTGTKSPINLTILFVAFLTCVWILRLIVVEKKVRLVPSKLNIPIFGFILVAVLAWIVGNVFLDRDVTLPSNVLQVQAGQFAMFALSAAALLLSANHELSVRTLKLWSLNIVFLGVIAVFCDVFAIRPNPLPAVKGSMHMWPFVIVLAQLLFNPNLDKRTHILAWPILGLWAYWAFFTPVFGFKGGWAPAGLAMFLLLVLRWRIPSVLFGSLATIALFATGVAHKIILGELSTGAGYRPLVWQDVLNMTSRDWLLGLGPVNYMYYWQSLGLESVTLQEVISRHPTLAPYWTRYIVIPSHNLYVDILAQTGVIGLILFLLFVVLALYLAWRLGRRLRAGFLKAYVYAVLCGFAGMAIGSFLFADWLIPFVYNVTISGFRHSVYTWLLLGTLVPLTYSMNEGENAIEA